MPIKGKCSRRACSRRVDTRGCWTLSPQTAGESSAQRWKHFIPYKSSSVPIRALTCSATREKPGPKLWLLTCRPQRSAPFDDTDRIWSEPLEAAVAPRHMRYVKPPNYAQGQWTPYHRRLECCRQAAHRRAPTPRAIALACRGHDRKPSRTRRHSHKAYD